MTEKMLFCRANTSPNSKREGRDQGEKKTEGSGNGEVIARCGVACGEEKPQNKRKKRLVTT